MAANMNKYKTSSGVISFEDLNFSQSSTENDSANDSSFSEEKEEEMTHKETYCNYKTQIMQCFLHYVVFPPT